MFYFTEVFAMLDPAGATAAKKMTVFPHSFETIVSKYFTGPFGKEQILINGSDKQVTATTRRGSVFAEQQVKRDSLEEVMHDIVNFSARGLLKQSDNGSSTVSSVVQGMCGDQKQIAVVTLWNNRHEGSLIVRSMNTLSRAVRELMLPTQFFCPPVSSVLWDGHFFTVTMLPPAAGEPVLDPRYPRSAPAVSGVVSKPCDQTDVGVTSEICACLDTYLLGVDACAVGSVSVHCHPVSNGTTLLVPAPELLIALADGKRPEHKLLCQVEAACGIKSPDPTEQLPAFLSSSPPTTDDKKKLLILRTVLHMFGFPLRDILSLRAAATVAAKNHKDFNANNISKWTKLMLYEAVARIIKNLIVKQAAAQSITVTESATNIFRSITGVNSLRSWSDDIKAKFSVCLEDAEFEGVLYHGIDSFVIPFVCHRLGISYSEEKYRFESAAVPELLFSSIEPILKDPAVMKQTGEQSASAAIRIYTVLHKQQKALPDSMTEAVLSLCVVLGVGHGLLCHRLEVTDAANVRKKSLTKSKMPLKNSLFAFPCYSFAQFIFSRLEGALHNRPSKKSDENAIVAVLLNGINNAPRDAHISPNDVTWAGRIVLSQIKASPDVDHTPSLVFFTKAVAKGTFASVDFDFDHVDIMKSILLNPLILDGMLERDGDIADIAAAFHAVVILASSLVMGVLPPDYTQIEFFYMVRCVLLLAALVSPDCFKNDPHIQTCLSILISHWITFETGGRYKERQSILATVVTFLIFPEFCPQSIRPCCRDRFSKAIITNFRKATGTMPVAVVLAALLTDVPSQKIIGQIDRLLIDSMKESVNRIVKGEFVPQNKPSDCDDYFAFFEDIFCARKSTTFLGKYLLSVVAVKDWVTRSFAAIATSSTEMAKEVSTSGSSAGGDDGEATEDNNEKYIDLRRLMKCPDCKMRRASSVAMINQKFLSNLMAKKNSVDSPKNLFSPKNKPSNDNAPKPTEKIVEEAQPQPAQVDEAQGLTPEAAHTPPTEAAAAHSEPERVLPSFIKFIPKKPASPPKQQQSTTLPKLSNSMIKRKANPHAKNDRWEEAAQQTFARFAQLYNIEDSFPSLAASARGGSMKDKELKECQSVRIFKHSYV